LSSARSCPLSGFGASKGWTVPHPEENAVCALFLRSIKFDPFQILNALLAFSAGFGIGAHFLNELLALCVASFDQEFGMERSMFEERPLPRFVIESIGRMDLDHPRLIRLSGFL
jgi:hypothetical protein